MKTFLFFSLIFLLSCSDERSDEHKNIPSHYFTDADYEYLPTVYDDVGKTFTFRNQLGEEVRLKVSSYEDVQYYVGPNGPREIGNYSRLSVRLVNEEYQDCFKEIVILKLDDDSLYFVFDISFNDSCIGWIGEEIEGPFETNEMFVNGKTYDKVTALFESYPSDVGGPFFHPDYIIDKIYYDFKHGIIGFDDISGDIKFRLVSQ